MSRTKEIEVWVSQDLANQDHGILSTQATIITSKKSEYYDINQVKAKLIIELPEKKVEITESQFDEVWRDASGDSWRGLAEDIKKKLFGDEG